MFGLLRNLYKWYKSRNEKIVKFALIGIDNAGKSTILARIKGEVPEFITPTIGFASETIEQGPYHIKIFDLGGGGNIRTIWPSYYAEIHGAIFVVDSADKARMNMARDVLHASLDHPRLNKKPLLIFANKQDLPDAFQSPEVALQLALEKFEDYSYNIVNCSAILADALGTPDPNIAQGLKWILGMVERNYSSLEKRIQREMAEQAEEDKREKEEKKKRIEAMRRERELEREKQQKEEELKAKEKEKEEKSAEEPKERLDNIRKSQSIIDVHETAPLPPSTPPIPSLEPQMGMTKSDFVKSSSTTLIPLSSSTRKLATLRHSPRNSVAPQPTDPSSPSSLAPPALSTLSSLSSPSSQPPSQDSTTLFTPRSAWANANLPNPKTKLAPIPTSSSSPSIHTM